MRKPIEQPDWVKWIGLQTNKDGEAITPDGEVIKVPRRGMEVPDPQVMAIPTGFGRPETLAEQVRRLVRSERQQDDGDETWDDAQDFDIGDDFDPRTPYEVMYDETLQREVTPQEMMKNWPQIKEEAAKKLRNYYRFMEQEEEQAATIEKLKREAAEGAAPSSPRAKPAPAKPSSPEADQ